MLTDIKAAFRSIKKSPGYALVIIATLALGIGANAAIFSFFNAVLLRRLPFDQPQRTVLVKDRPGDLGEIVGAKVGLFSEDFRELELQVNAFESMATFTLDAATMNGRERPDLVFGAVVSQNFFSVLGSTASAGTVFTERDQVEGRGRTVVLSHRYWQNAFGGDRAVIGSGITLNNVSFTVVGVMPPDFDFPRAVNFWASPAERVPEAMIGTPPGMERGTNNAGRGNRLRSIVARLRPGVTVEHAQKELAGLCERLPNPNEVKRSVFLVTVRDQTIGEIRPVLVTLLGCVGIVLLIACANVANLTLSRLASRQHEMKLRLALGSSRWLVLRRQLVESLILAVAGGGLGLLGSQAALGMLAKAAQGLVPRTSYVATDATVIVYAVVLTLVTGIACGLVPLLALGDKDLVSALKSSGRSSTASPAALRLRAIFVAGEVAIAVILLVAAGLLLRSFWKTQSYSWGFDADRVATARVGFTTDRYHEKAAQRTFYRALMEKLGSRSEFTAVSASFDRNGFTWIHLRYQPEGQEYQRPQEAPEARYRIISPGYFETLGIRLLQGRDFSASDNEGSHPVVMVDAELARRYFPEGQAVGRRIRLMLGDPTWAEIVGVVANVKSDGPGQVQRSDLYMPFAQHAMDSLFVQARTTGSIAQATETIQKVVHELDPQLPVVDVASMEQVVDRASEARWFPLFLVTVFSLLALILASVGIYAVSSFGVVQRTREIGLRMAVGAQPSEVVGLILRQGMRPILIGLGLGLMGAVWAALGMRTLLFGIDAFDLETFLCVPLPMIVVSFVACWLPARAAAKVDPLIAMRQE